MRMGHNVFAVLGLLVVPTLLACERPATSAQQASTPTTQPAANDTEAADVYTYLDRPSRDGIGKVYMGREISHVMGHLAAGWLERDGREMEEKPAVLIEALDLQPADVVADIGAGTGYFTFRMAEKVPDGRVIAVDIQQEMLDLLEAEEARRGMTNVEPILGDIDGPKLPAGEVDLVLMVDAYHEFSHPYEMMQGIVAGLKPGGRVALVEYRGEDPAVMIKPLHKMTQAQAIKEMTAVGLEHVETIDALPLQHLMIFRKTAAG